MLDNYRVLENKRIEIRYLDGDYEFAQEALLALDGAFDRVTQYFSFSGLFPTVRVILVTNRYEFDRLVRDLLKVEIEVPSHPARIAQPQRTDLVAISPSAYEAETIFQYNLGEFQRLMVHELIHMVEEHLSPNIELSPRWWGEGLAVYLSEQWRYDNEYKKIAIDGIEQKNIPSFRQIEMERKMAYDWGWTIVKYIETKYGTDMILRIVNECADGKVFAMIGDNVNLLERQWKQWLLSEYKNI